MIKAMIYRRIGGKLVPFYASPDLRHTIERHWERCRRGESVVLKISDRGGVACISSS